MKKRQKFTGWVGPTRLPDGSQNPAYHRAHYLAYREERLADNRRRHKLTGARKYQVTGVDYRTMLYSVIRQRDGDACSLCNKPLDEDRISVDHIIPRFRGGTHEATNLRLAHLTCNMRRARGKLK